MPSAAKSPKRRLRLSALGIPLSENNLLKFCFRHEVIERAKRLPRSKRYTDCKPVSAFPLECLVLQWLGGSLFQNRHPEAKEQSDSIVCRSVSSGANAGCFLRGCAEKKTSETLLGQNGVVKGCPLDGLWVLWAVPKYPVGDRHQLSYS